MLQASEGGSISVGNQKFKVKASVTPPPVVTPPVTPISATRLEGTPVAMPVNVPTERIARVPSSRFSTLATATDKIVVSKNVLIGLCLTTFAFGIVTTLAVDRIHARAGEAPREPEPVVLKTTPIELEVKAPAAAAPATEPTPVAAAQPAPAPAAAPAATTQPAAAEAVVVQLPPASEAAPRLPARPSPPRAARQVAAAPARAAPTPRKRASAAVESDPTEAAPDDGPAPAPVKKKWVDPFDE